MNRVKRIDFVVGNRPQFIKLFPLFHALRKLGQNEVEARIIHTGQHFDTNMSAAFFELLQLPKPYLQFRLQATASEEQVPEMLANLKGHFVKEKPDLVVVLGDTNSTLAGALAANQLGIPLAHLEAGLRSYDSSMPEERNRIQVDQLSQWLFVPHQAAKGNLVREGIPNFNKKSESKVVVCGDVMLDALMLVQEQKNNSFSLFNELEIISGQYYLATVHRQANTDNPRVLIDILNGLQSVAERSGFPVVFPVHPRTQIQIQVLQKTEKGWKNIRFISPQDYLATQHLIMGSLAVLTDSGGLQKEACLHGKHTWVLRDRTEWNELVDIGASALSGGGFGSIEAFFEFLSQPAVQVPRDWYGGGKASSVFWRHVLGYENGFEKSSY